MEHGIRAVPEWSIVVEPGLTALALCAPPPATPVRAFAGSALSGVRDNAPNR
jgi:hypothetical protein